MEELVGRAKPADSRAGRPDDHAWRVEGFGAYLERSGYKQLQLAALSGVGQQHISALRVGKCYLSEATARKLAPWIAPRADAEAGALKARLEALGGPVSAGEEPGSEARDEAAKALAARIEAFAAEMRLAHNLDRFRRVLGDPSGRVTEYDRKIPDECEALMRTLPQCEAVLDAVVALYAYDRRRQLARFYLRPRGAACWFVPALVWTATTSPLFDFAALWTTP